MPPDTPSPDSDWKWSQLLDYIAAGLVVPVVGRELLWATLDGERQHVSTYLARRLALRADIPALVASEPDPTSAVVQHYLSSRTKGRTWPYTALSQLTRDLEGTPVPPSLLKLAELPFGLFVSTTTDTYLERALNEVRFDGRAETLVPRYGLGSKVDLPERAGGSHTVVFPLLGRANPSPDYAITDEDVLEFVHQFQSTGTPRRLLDTLRQSHLLLIGGGFSDWLVRFLVRLAKPERLWASTTSQQTVFVADRCVTEDARLLAFLQHPLSDTEIFQTVHAERFVDELHRRWKLLHPAPGPAVGTDRPRADTGLRPRGVFLSYCHEDFATAQRIREALDSAGIDVWFDERDVHAGDEFERLIAGQIAKSLFFIAVVSERSLTSEPRFFRFEWHEAEKRSKYAAFDVPYVLPVAIDETSTEDERLPHFLRKVQWTRAPAGDVPRDFIETLIAAYRRVQRSARTP
jgi:hypothetical protein